MAEDKNKTDSDRIKELLAQLRATMNLEEDVTANVPEDETEPEEGYEATAEELLFSENASDVSSEQAETIKPKTQEEQALGEELSEEVREETPASVGHGSRDKNATADQVAAVLSSFVVADEGETTMPDTPAEQESDEDNKADETEAAAPVLDTEEDTEQEDEAKDTENAEDTEDTAIFFVDNSAVTSFDDKIRLSASAAFSLPKAEAEEEETVVSAGEFVPELDEETMEDSSEDGEAEELLPVLLGKTLAGVDFARRVSLASWGAENGDGTDEGVDETTDENLNESTAESANEQFDETAETVAEVVDGEEDRASAEAEEIGMCEELVTTEDAAPDEAETDALMEDIAADVLNDETRPLPLLAVCDEEAGDSEDGALPCGDDSSPPDFGAFVADEGLSVDPFPYRAEHDEEAKTMVFERVEGDGEDETPAPAPLPVEETPVAPSFAEESNEVPLADEVDSAEKTQVSAEDESERHSPRIQLAPLAYRANKEEEKEEKPTERDGEETEDYLNSIPGVMRHLLGDYPFGRANRVQNAHGTRKEKMSEEETPPSQKAKPKKKKRRRFFAEEEEREYCDTADSNLIRERLQNDLNNTRARFVIISVFALLLLVLENYAFVPFFSDRLLLTAEKVGYAETFLLFGVALAAAPCLYMGACGLFYRRILPETVLLVQWLLSFSYALVFAILELEVPHFAFGAALSLCVCLFFRMIGRENRVSCFRHLTTAGDKLILSPTEKKAMQAEINALGRSLDDAPPAMYRVRKTAFVDEFSYRTATVCEDSIINFVILLLYLVSQAASFFIGFFLSGDVIQGFSSLALALAVVPPVAMCATHIYPMARALRAAGNDSTILGEDTVNEAVALDAIAFEDIEAIPTKDVNVTFVQIYENPIFVLSCLNAIFRTIGGPLAGYFSAADQTKEAAKRKVVLTEAVSGGFSVTVDGANVCVGDGEYMERKNTIPVFDAKDAKAESENQNVLYVAMEGKVCAKFYIRYHVSAAFEKNVRRLSRLGITALVRTYDPCLSDRTLLRISSLADQKIHVVNKTPSQRADFAASHAPGGIVTSGHSGKLLQLLFLCFGTRRTIVAGSVMKLILTALGLIGAVTASMLGLFRVMPSAIVALYHIVWLFLSVMYVRCRIYTPKLTEGKRNESSKNIRHSKGGR